MSSVLEPTTCWPRSPARVFHLAMMPVWVASLANAVRLTRWLVDVERARSTSPVRLSMTRLVSETTWPYEAALVTRRGLPLGSGIEHVYGWWVWPVTIGVDRRRLHSVAVERRDRLGDAHALAGRCRRLAAALVHAARRSPSRPPCVSSRACGVGRLDLVLEPRPRPRRPASTRLGGALEGHPDEADLRPADPFLTHVPGRRALLVRVVVTALGGLGVLDHDVRGQPREVGAGIRARRRSSTRRPGGGRHVCMRSSSAVPSSNSWLPTLLTSRPIAFRALHRRLVVEETGQGTGEPPMRSPAATVSDSCRRPALRAQRRSGPWSRYSDSADRRLADGSRAAD